MLGELGVHSGVGQQVVQVGVESPDRWGFVEVVDGALVIGDFCPGDAAASVVLRVSG